MVRRVIQVKRANGLRGVRRWKEGKRRYSRCEQGIVFRGVRRVNGLKGVRRWRKVRKEIEVRR